MNDETPTPADNRLEAQPDDPVLSIHILGQFAFCARAGLCAYETQTAWEGAEPAPANVGYLPRYELTEIEQAFESKLRGLLWAICPALLGALVALRLPRGILVDVASAGLFLLYFLGFVLPRLLDLSELARRQRAYRSAEPQEVDVTRAEPQPVHWFGLLKAGYLSVDYPEALRHEAWKCCGWPWRVLRRGNQRIPVFKQSEGGALHHKHLVKAAGYCHLARTCENAESPFAVILKEESYEGVAIAFDVAARKRFHEALRQARSTVRSAQLGIKPPAPEQKSRCRDCPFGKPIPFVPGQTENHKDGVALPVFALRGAEPTVYHCHCADRFEEMPPHGLVEEQGLRPIT